MLFNNVGYQVHPDETPPNERRDFLPDQPSSFIDDEKFLSGSFLSLRQLYHIPFDALTTIRANMEEYAERRIKSIKVCLTKRIFFT